MNKLIAVVGVAATVFVGAFSTQYAFKAEYVMKNSVNFPNGYVTGTLYYRYDSENALNSRLRYDTSYSLDGTSVVSSDLYFYGEPKALFSFCDKCSASVLTGELEPWWNIKGDVCSEVNGFLSCTRTTSDSHGVVEMMVKSGDPSTSGFTIKSIKLNDGNELEFKSFSLCDSNDGKFGVPSDCPNTVTCRSYMDLVFILDTSGSVDDDEWQSTKDFVMNVTKQITVGPKDAYVGVIEFNGPYKDGWGQCNFCPSKNAEYIDITSYGCEAKYENAGCSDIPCRRYLEDYPFDTNCKNDQKNRANVLVELTQNNVINKIQSMDKGFGNTCQRYGLNKAYDMLFTNNARCKSGVCPTPVVIVVTDGADQCHASTITAAERLRSKMQEYGGFLLEVGVGLHNDYDRQYIANLSSNLLGYDATYNVDNYTVIEGIIKNVITPVCELTQLGGTCGPTCKGFCACSKCVCPMCGGNDTSVCRAYQCDVANTDRGCYVDDVKCVDPVLEATKCYDMWCDPDQTDPDQKCRAKVKDCKAEVEAKLGRPLKACEYIPECVNNTVGCTVGRNHTYCQVEVSHQNCKIGQCVGDGGWDVDQYGCKFIDDNCSNSPLWDVCNSVSCNKRTGVCQAERKNCKIDDCTKIDDSGALVPACEDRPCQKTKCENGVCSYEPLCKPANLCRKSTCEQDTCVEEPYDSLNCSSRNTLCTTYTCDPDYDDGKGGCKPEKAYHEETECTMYVCDDVVGWQAVPRCTTDEPCKVAKCLSGGECYNEEIDCRETLNIDDECHDGSCDVEGDGGCQLTIVYGSFIDICGNCKKEGEDDDDGTDCIEAPEKEVTREGLAGAAVALIVIGAIILGAAIAASTVFGTKALIDRARGAENQAVVSNPLFEESQTEMANPAFVGDTV